MSEVQETQVPTEAPAVEETVQTAQAEVPSEPVQTQAEEAPLAQVEETAPEAAATAETEESVGEEGEGEQYEVTPSGKKVVRLRVGQERKGVVKRVTDFGIFVDIGAGRDGLVHVSEISVNRVRKPSDVVQEGQEVTVWIKKLDRERNRISLTMISPDTKTIRDLEEGQIVEGTVVKIMPYGAFVDIGVGTNALLHVREMSSGYVQRPEDVVQVGETIQVRIIGLNKRKRRIDVSLKGLREEEEQPEEAQVEEAVAEAVEEEDEEAVLSPIELALKRAMEAEGIKLRTGKKGKRKKRKGKRDLQDEIIQRTLQAIKES